VITIEHNTDVIRRADWIIDLGPEGGDNGGQVMFQGTPAELKKSPKALIAKYM
jgi:excinuclease ABC subunit A